MSLYTVYSNDTAGKQQKLRDRLAANIHSSIDIAKSQKQANYNLIFNNPDGLTPQECFDALGSDAVKYLTISALMLNVIHALDPSWSAPVPSQTLTQNQDGTVTVS